MLTTAPTIDDVREYRSEIERLAATRKVSNVRVFGSVAKGTSQAESDIDFLVDPESECSGLDLGGFLYDLERLLQRPVQVLTPNALHWYIRSEILHEAVSL